VVIEQLDFDADGYSLRTFKIQTPPEKQFTVAFADEYAEPCSGPFHFLDEHHGKAFEKGFADCKSWKLPESRFTIVDGERVFQHSWEGIPTERNCLSYYALSLPEFAVPTQIRFKDPRSDRLYPKNVVRDGRRNRFVTYLGCRSSYGSFDFSLQVRFRNDQENFRRAKYADEHMAKLGVQIDAYKHLLPTDQRLVVQQFFLANAGQSQASGLPFPPLTLNPADGKEVVSNRVGSENSGRPREMKSDPFANLPAKQQRLSMYFDNAKLTDLQLQVASLKWEYGLSVSEIARRFDKHRSTIDEHLAAIKGKVEQAHSAEKRAAKGRVSPE
jgi:predicted DNA-binding protein YlxM (UPF0122 family)